MIVSFLLNIEIRKHSKLKNGYENVHKLLYERFPVTKSGFTEDDVITLLKEVSGQDMKPTWDNYIRGTDKIDFTSLLKQLGLELSYKNKEDDKDIPRWTGIVLEKNKSEAIAKNILRDSPA